MAYDPRTGKLVLFGGTVLKAGRQVLLNDTWTYDGRTWTEQSPGTRPPARWMAAMTYDPVIGRIVLFGGAHVQGEPFNDTWTFDGVSWIQQHPATSPNLIERLMDYDSAIGKLVLLGHPAAPTSGDPDRIETWTYDGTTWTRESPAASISGLYGMFGGGVNAVYDVGLDRFVFNQGDTYTYDGKTWTKQPGPHIYSLSTGASVAYDSALEHTVVFGGNGWDLQNRGGQVGPPLNDTWIHNGSSWTKQSLSTAPTPRSGASMVYDPALQSLVLFGGVDYRAGIRGAEKADTWTYESTHRG
jgi:hypothetical protein